MSSADPASPVSMSFMLGKLLGLLRGRLEPSRSWSRSTASSLAKLSLAASREEEEASCPGPAKAGASSSSALGAGSVPAIGSGSSPRTTAVARPGVGGLDLELEVHSTGLGQLAPGRSLMQLVTSHGLEGVAGARRRVVVGRRSLLPAPAPACSSGRVGRCTLWPRHPT